MVAVGRQNFPSKLDDKDDIKEMKKDKIWVSRAMTDTRLVHKITSSLAEKDSNSVFDAMQRNERGEPLPADRFPSVLFGMYPDKHFTKLPDICNADGFWIVSSQCAEILRQFDLGRTSLYPTKVCQHDRKTPVEGHYSCINFGEIKNDFEPEASPRAKPFAASKDLTRVSIWKLPLAPKDGDIAVKQSAREGVDLWIDPKVRKAFFLSDRLVKALKQAGLTRYFGLLKCRVVEAS